MIVYYRLTSIASTNPSPLYNNDKLRLNQLCLRSFVTAFRDVKPEMVFIADYCGKEYDEIIKEIVPFPFKIIYTSEGINATALRQYDMAYKGDDEDILFAECDYLWRPSSAKAFIEGLNKLELISPYDNLNFYLDPSIHSENVKLRLVGDQHWRSVERVTMTFGLKKKILTENYDLFLKYGYLDNDLWHELRERGHQMWTPIPSLSTHMVRDYMAPVIPWPLVWKIFDDSLTT